MLVPVLEAGLVHFDWLTTQKCASGVDTVVVPKLGLSAQVRLLLAGKDATPPECALHPGRIVCQVERLLSA